MPNSFDPSSTDIAVKYPHIAQWVSTYGWIEIGVQYEGRLFARGLDEGGLIWEGKNFKTLDEAMQALELGIAQWVGKNL